MCVNNVPCALPYCTHVVPAPILPCSSSWWVDTGSWCPDPAGVPSALHPTSRTTSPGSRARSTAPWSCSRRRLRSRARERCSYGRRTQRHRCRARRWSWGGDRSWRRLRRSCKTDGAAEGWIELREDPLDVSLSVSLPSFFNSCSFQVWTFSYNHKIRRNNYYLSLTLFCTRQIQRNQFNTKQI